MKIVSQLFKKNGKLIHELCVYVCVYIYVGKIAWNEKEIDVFYVNLKLDYKR